MYSVINLKDYGIMLLCNDDEIDAVCEIIENSDEEIDEVLDEVCGNYDCNVVDFKEI